VYITVNLINGKCYVGDHTIKNLNDGYRGSGTLLFRAFKKYGRKNFLRRILGFYSTKKEAFNAQKEYIIKYNSLSPNGYNISPTGGIGCMECHSEETKQIMSELKIAYYQTPAGIVKKEIFRKQIKDFHKTPAGIKARAKAIATRKAFYQSSDSLSSRLKISRRRKAWFKTPEGITFRQRQKNMLVGRDSPLNKPEVQKKRNASFKTWYQSPEGIAWKERMLGKNSPCHSPKALQRRTESRARLLLQRQG
jgi:hypothetical protein